MELVTTDSDRDDIASMTTESLVLAIAHPIIAFSERAQVLRVMMIAELVRRGEPVPDIDLS